MEKLIAIIIIGIAFFLLDLLLKALKKIKIGKKDNSINIKEVKVAIASSEEPPITPNKKELEVIEKKRIQPAKREKVDEPKPKKKQNMFLNLLKGFGIVFIVMYTITQIVNWYLENRAKDFLDSHPEYQFNIDNIKNTTPSKSTTLVPSDLVDTENISFFSNDYISFYYPKNIEVKQSDISIGNRINLKSNKISSYYCSCVIIKFDNMSEDEASDYVADGIKKVFDIYSLSYNARTLFKGFNSSYKLVKLVKEHKSYDCETYVFNVQSITYAVVKISSDMEALDKDFADIAKTIDFFPKPPKDTQSTSSAQINKKKLDFFSNDYISFYYPKNWELAQNETPLGYEIHLESNDYSDNYCQSSILLFTQEFSEDEALKFVLKGFLKTFDAYKVHNSTKTSFKGNVSVYKKIDVSKNSTDYFCEAFAFTRDNNTYVILKATDNKNGLISNFSDFENTFEFLNNKPKANNKHSINIDSLERLAKNGDVKCQLSLAYAYFTGDGASIDYKKAFYWNNKMAEAGYAGAMYILGFQYKEGIGTKKNIEKGDYWIKEAKRNGYEQ